MKVEVVSSVSVTITQEDLEAMVAEKIKAHDANINIKSIEFVQRRNPSRIIVDVHAQYGEIATDDEPTETTEDSSVETVGDIFGSDQA